MIATKAMQIGIQKIPFKNKNKKIKHQYINATNDIPNLKVIYDLGAVRLINLFS